VPHLAAKNLFPHETSPPQSPAGLNELCSRSLNSNGAQLFTVSTHDAHRRARLPTLMLAAAANATATPAPGRHRRFANGFSRRPFRYPARDLGVVGCRVVSGLTNASGWRMILARGRQEKMVG